MELRLTRNLLLSSGYTYLDARDKETNAFLSQRHRHHGNFRILYSTDRLGGLRTNLWGTYFGKWPIVGRAGSSVGDTYQIWDWYLAKPLKRGIELFTSVDNLLDSQDSGLTAVQPTFFRADPGRLMRVGIRWRFGVE